MNLTEKHCILSQENTQAQQIRLYFGAIEPVRGLGEACQSSTDTPCVISSAGSCDSSGRTICTTGGPDTMPLTVAGLTQNE